MARKISDKENDHVLKVWDKFEMKKSQTLSRLVLKMLYLIVNSFFEKKNRNSSLKIMDYVQAII